MSGSRFGEAPPILCAGRKTEWTETPEIRKNSPISRVEKFFSKKLKNVEKNGLSRALIYRGVQFQTDLEMIL